MSGADAERVPDQSPGGPPAVDTTPAVGARVRVVGCGPGLDGRTGVVAARRPGAPAGYEFEVVIDGLMNAGGTLAFRAFELVPESPTPTPEETP